MKKIFLPLVFLIFISCVKTSKSKSLINHSGLTQIELDELEVRNPFLTDADLDSCRFVKLEKRADCIVGWPEKIVVKDDLIFVKDNNANLFVFDINGYFKNRIGQLGSGPDELLALSGFYVNQKSKYVAIWDAMRSQIIKYSYNGQIISKIKCDAKYMNLFSDMIMVDSNTVALNMYMGHNSNFNYRLVDEQNYNLVGNGLLYIVDKLKETNVNLTSSVATNDNQSFAITMLSDTIYMFSNGVFSPKYVLKSKLKPTTNEVASDVGSYNSINDILKYLRKSNYSEGVSNLFATNDYLYFNYFVGKNYYEVFWAIGVEKGFYRLNYISHNIFKSTRYLMTSTSDAFVCLIPPMDAIADQNGKYAINDDRVKNVMKNLNAEDNPIIGFYYIRKGYADYK